MKKNSFVLIEIFIVTMLFVLLFAFAFGIYSQKKNFDEQRQAKYALWVKMSGRSDISQKEFEILNEDDKLMKALPKIHNADPEKREE